MVVSVSGPATKVGVEILQRGGNAVDAAVAVAFALAVTYPPAGNIGGGGFMMVFSGPGQQPLCIEYRETAPAAATATMYKPGDPKVGHKVVGVPGTVRGLALAHQKYGKLPWRDVVLPAAKLADLGFSIDAHLAASLQEFMTDKQTQPFLPQLSMFRRGDGTPWKKDDLLEQRQLGGTLRLLAEQGPDAFYTGPIADQIVAEMQAGGGLITKADLAAYQARVRQPIHGTFRGYDIYAPPPPSSGGIALVEMLNILETFDLAQHGRYSPDTFHLMIEAMRRAYLDRARHLGDADFVKIPTHLTTKEYARELARQIDRHRATPSESLAPDIPLAGEGDSTTHFCVVDQGGMAVSNTYTLEGSYGARVVVRGAGFLLNNEMGDFNWTPGRTDRQGAIGTPANQIAPGKRMLSSQTPTIVLRDGKLVMLTGSPGGRTIINTVLCVLLNALEFDLPPPECVAAPRLHHQWLPDKVRFEAGGNELTQALAELRSRGHRLDDKPSEQGDAHSIWIDPRSGHYIGVADGRKSGTAQGY